MKRISLAALSALLVCAAVVSAVTAIAGKGGNWPQFRGPEGQGVSRETNVPLEWSATKNVLWKTPIEGRGHSQPIIWGRHVS